MDEDLDDQLYEYEDDMLYDEEESDANLEQDLHGLIDSGLIDEQLQQTLLGVRGELTDNPPANTSPFSFIFQEATTDLQYREMEIQRLEQHLIQLAKKDDLSSSAPSSNSNNINKDNNAALDTLNPTKNEDRTWNSIDDKQLFGDETLMDEKYYEALQQLGQHVVEDHLSDAPLSWSVEDNDDIVGLLENAKDEENLADYNNLMKKYIQNVDSWSSVQSTSNLMFLKRMRLLQRIHLAISREKERLLIPHKPFEFPPPAPAPTPAPTTSSSKSKRASKSAEKQNTPPAQVLDKLINTKQSMTEIIKKFLSSSVIAKLPLCLTHENPENVEKFQTRLSQFMKGKSQPQYVDQRVQATVAMILLALSTGSVRWLLHAVRSLLDDFSVNNIKTASSEWIKYPIAGYLKRLDKFRKYTEISAIVPEAYLKSFRYYWNPKLNKQKSRMRTIAAPAGQASSELIATDGSYMYVYSDKGLVKVGTGYNGTIPGKIYDSILGYRSKDKLVDIVCVRDKLCLISSSIKAGCVLVINAATLQEEGLVDFAAVRDTSDEIVQITKEHMITSTNNRIRLTSDGQYLYTIVETTCTIPLDPPPLPTTPSSPQPTSPEAPKSPATPPATPTPPPTTTVKKYWVDIFNIGSNTVNQNNASGLTATLVRRTELKLANPPPPATSGKAAANQAGHEGVSCNACHRIAFRLKRYQCKVCSSYNLCSTCYSSGVFANNQSSIGHRPEHFMEAIDIPIPPPPSPAKSTAAPVTSPTAPFTYDAFNRCCFYTTGHQLGIVLAPKVLPNKSDKYICRVFDLNASNIPEEGNFIYDVATESYSITNTICYDRLNNLLWTLHQYNRTLSQWRNFGPAAIADPTFSPDAIMNNPKFILPKPGSPINLSSSGGNTNKAPVKLSPILPEVVVVNILGQLDLIHKKQVPLSEGDDSSQMLNAFHRIHFGPEPSTDNINELLSVLEWGMHRYMENIHSASAVTQQFVTYLIVSCLSLLKSSLQFAFQVPDPIFKQAIASDADITNRTFLIVSRLFESAVEDPEQSPIHAELSDLLLSSIDAFFPTPQKKADVLVHLLAGNGLVREGISVRGPFITDGKLCKKFVESFMTSMLKTISIEHVITETTGPTHVPNKLLPVLIEESNRELYSYYQALVNSLSNPAQTASVSLIGCLAMQQPNLALRLLCNFQKELFSNSPSEAIVHLTLYYSKLVFDASVDMVKKTLQLHETIAKAHPDSTPDSVFRTLENVLEYSMLGTVLPMHLVSLGLFLENVGPSRDQPTYPLHFLPPLKDLLSHLDHLNKLFPSLAQSEIKYLQHVIPAYDTASKVAESPHPYTEYTNKEITVSVPGALCLYVYFDPKCETESESDYVQIWRRKNEPISKKFYGQALVDSKQDNGANATQAKNTWPEKPLVIPGDSMVIYLHSEGQASRTHRWGFRIFVKGIMSTHPVNISWYFDLEKTAAVLAGKLVESLISGDFTDTSKLQEEEHTLCRYSFMQQGVEETTLNDNPSDVVMQDASQNSEMQVEPQADTFLQDLVEGKGQASALHTQLCSKLRPKVLPVPKSVEELVEITSRRVLAVLLKLSSTVHQAASTSPVPSSVTDIWTAVYATRFRKWIRLMVQQARSGTTVGENENVSSTAIPESTTPEISVESAYQSICANVQSLCAFLMKLNPGRSASTSSVVNEVLTFIESSPKVTSLSQLVSLQALRAQYRAMGFKLVTEFLNSVSLGSVKQDILSSIGQAIRRNSENHSVFQYHYLAGLETCSPSLKLSVCSSFDTLVKHILVMLNQATSDYRLQLLVLDCLNLVFKPRDSELLSRLEFTQLIHQLAIGKISVWNLSVEDRKSISLTNPVVNTSLPSSEITPQNLILSSASSSQLVEQLVGGCCEVGKTVGPVVPQRFTHQQVAAKGLAKEQEFTISLWLYPIKAATSQPAPPPAAPAPSGQPSTSTTSWRTIIFKGTDTPENQKTRSPALFYSVEDLSLALCVSTASNWNVCLRSASEVPFDQWTHVACVLDNNVLAIYINGIRDSEMILGEPILFNEHPFCIGTTPQAINEKLGFHGFVENVQYYYNTLSDSNMIKLIQKSTPLPPEFTLRHKHDVKKLKYLGSTLFNLLAINVLTWDVTTEDQETQKRIQHFQDSIIEILVAELSDELTSIQKQMNSTPVISLDADKLYNDERCYEILVLVFKLRKAVPVCRYFSQPQVITGLAERVLQENTAPRIQRLLIRLFRHILMHTNPVELAQSSQSKSFADFLLSKVGALYLVGSAPGAHPDSTEAPMTIDQTSLPSTGSREGTEFYVVMLHSCPGLTPDEVSRALQKQITKEISAALTAVKTTGAPMDLFSYIRGIALEAQEMGKAVLKTGAKDECVAIAVKLAKAGFVCTLIEVPHKANEHSDNRNVALSTNHTNPQKVVTGQIAYGTACEIVMLLRHLWKSNDTWGAFWRDYCTSALVGLNKLLQAKTSELVTSPAQLQHLERTFGVLSLLGGLAEGFRVGCKVEVHTEPDPDSHMLTHAYLSAHSSLSLTRSDERARRIASIIEYDRLGGVATIIYDSDSAKKAVIISVGYLRPIPEFSLLGEHFPLTGDILSNFASFLKGPVKTPSPVGQKASAKAPVVEPAVILPLEQDNPLVYSHLKTLALRSFLHLLQSKESVMNYLALMQAGALPLLTDVAASFGQVRVDQLNLHEQKILKIVQRLHEGQLNHLYSNSLASALGALPLSPLPSDNNTNNNSPSPSTKKPRYKDVIPYSPYCSNEELLLPTSLSHKGSEVHHAIPINERTVEFYGYDGDELILVSDHPVPSGVPEFYFEIRLEMDSLESQLFAREKEKERVEKEKQSQGFDFGTAAPPPAPPAPPAPAPAQPASPAKIHCNFSIGLVPSTGLPVWANGTYGYHSTKGQKSSVVKKEAFRNLPRYRCPFCKVDGISERELCFHVQRRHANGVKRVVCPICATSPFGNPNYVSNDFRGHLSERHARKLPPDPCPPVHEKYGPTFNHGDIIGCGYNKEEGTIYFTLNGKYLGIAFINVEGAYYPLVALRTPNTRLTANFGQEPFAFDPNTKQNKTLIRKEEKEYKEKLKKDEEARIKKEQEEQAAILSNRLVQASMLQGFVGFPLKYCMHALQRNNENIELAAEWSMTNFEAYSLEHPELFENDDDFATGASQPAPNQPSQNAPSENTSSQSLEQDPMQATDEEDEDMDLLPFENLTYHLGYTYSLSQFDKEDPTGSGRAKRLKSSKVNLDQLQVGQQLFVNVVDYSVVGRNWVPYMEKTLSRTGIVKEVDSLYLEVLLQFIFDEECATTEWWYPVRVLTIPSRYRRDPFPSILTAELTSLIRLALDENDKLAQMYICKAATIFEELTNVYQLDRSQAVPQTIVGGPPSLINLLQVVSREYMTQPLPDLSMNPCKTPFLEKLRTKLNALCTEAANNAKSNNTNPIVEVILQESLRMLKTASDFVTKFSIVEESEHPYAFAGEVSKKIHIDKSSALFVTFEKKSRLAGGDKIVFYADDEYSSMVAMATGAQFVPTVIPSDTVYIKYMPSKDVKSLDKSWGYRYSIAPSIPEFNMSMWLLQYLMSNASHYDIENIHVRIFKTLFTYLYNTSLPIAIKVIVLRMLTRILQVSGLLPDDIKSSDPRRMRDTLRAELEELLRNPQKSDLASPYLQSLAELMVETKFVMAPFTPFYENADSMAVATYNNGYSRDMSLFDKLCELKLMVKALQYRDGENQMPFNAIVDAVKMTSLSENMDESTYVKVVSQSLTQGKLKDITAQLFNRFDINRDGLLNEEEFNHFQLSSGQNPYSDSETDNFASLMNAFAAENGGAKGFTVQGLVALHEKIFANDRAALCRRLRALGVDSSLSVVSKETETKIDYVEVASQQSQWSLDMDEQLVQFINELTDRLGCDVLSLTPAILNAHNNSLENNNNNLTLSGISSNPNSIWRLPLHSIKTRFAILKIFNEFASQTLPLIDLSQINVYAQSFAHQLSTIRTLLFYDIKMSFLREALTKTAIGDKEPPTIYLDRLDALKQLESDMENSNCVFIQGMKQLHPLNTAILRQKERAFKVIFKGEHAEGEVGPYRESISQMCMELHNEQVLPLLIPCPNQQLAKESIGVGENREKFIINPATMFVDSNRSSSAKTTNADFGSMYEFFGKLIGIAIRSKNPLSLDLPSVFWKPLVGLKPNRQDLKEIDYSTIESLDSIEAMDENTFNERFAELQTFSTLLSDRKTSATLVPNGDQIQVTYQNRHEFVKLKVECLLNESKRQMDCIMKGLRTIVPVDILKLFSWRDIRYLVCGNPDVDLELLKKHTRYRGGVKNTDPHIMWFWETLEEFTPTERSLFLRFAWGRERLPPEREFSEEMKIFPSTKTTNHDNQLPHADTCFFNVSLPAYSTKPLMKEKLLVAITHTMAMDGDTRADQNDVGFGLRAFREQNMAFIEQYEDDDDY